MAELAMGIDLGTTYSCVCIYRNGVTETIPTESGAKCIPSYVTFHPEGRLLGEASRDSSFETPKQAVFGFKRIIGKRFEDPEVQKNKERWPFSVIDKNGFPVVRVEEDDAWHTYSPVEISAMILAYLRQAVETYLDEPVTKAVITVPANFTDAQRKATKEAGLQAGLDVIGMINEPTAAALSYGLQKTDIEQKILVFDFGGGTLDVAILKVSRGSLFEILASSGLMNLGGEDFDEILLDRFIREFNEKHLVNLRDDVAAVSRLRLRCERVKRGLSGKNGVGHLSVDALHGSIHFVTSIKRAEFEELCKGIFSRILDPVREALNFAGLAVNEIDRVVLVGGSSRIPKVQEMLRNFFPDSRHHRDNNPDEAIAQGAAMYAHSKLVDPRAEVTQVNDIVIIEKTPFSLGVRVVNGNMAVIIPRGSKIPAQGTQTCTTSSKTQTTVRIKVYEGEKRLAEENNFLGELTLLDIVTPDAGGSPLILLTFSYDLFGCVNVSAQDVHSGESKSVTINCSTRTLS